MGPLLDGDGHLTSKYVEEAEVPTVFFTSVFKNDDGP